MTVEMRTMIEPNDIIAVELKCRKCKARILLPLSGLDQVPTVCSSRCDTQFIIHSSEEHARLHHFVRRIKDYAEAKSEPYTLRFEVKGITDPKSA